MPETQIREVIQGLMKYDVLVSIPENAGFGLEIERAFPSIKRIMIKKDNPLRVEGIAKDGVFRAFIFGETSKMKDNPSYLDEFIKMAKYSGDISEIGAMQYEHL